jgi:hypothetical protein
MDCKLFLLPAIALLIFGCCCPISEIGFGKFEEQAKLLCDNSGGVFTPSSPSAAWSCQCAEGKGFDSNLGCIRGKAPIVENLTNSSEAVDQKNSTETANPANSSTQP